MVSQSIYRVSLKLSAMFRYCYSQSCHEKIYQRNSHTGYCRKTRCWHHHTIAVQGIRNDDQSLSPVTPLICLLFLSFEMFRNIINLLVIPRNRSPRDPMNSPRPRIVYMECPIDCHMNQQHNHVTFNLRIYSGWFMALTTLPLLFRRTCHC